MLTPCKDCEHRRVGCHSGCPDYKLFKEEQEKIKKERDHETLMIGMCKMASINREKRNKRSVFCTHRKK